jgi:hypothetical protein
VTGLRHDVTATVEEMVKGKKKAAQKSAPRTTGVAKKSEEIGKIRNQVRNVILDQSTDMAKRIVRSVNEEGNVGALKFLWETARLFPTGDAEEESGGGESMAKMLLKALGLPTEPPSEEEEEHKQDDHEEEEETNGEGDVESEVIGSSGDRVIG